MLLALLLVCLGTIVSVPSNALPILPAQAAKQADDFAIDLRERLQSDDTLMLCFSRVYHSITKDGCRSLDEAAKKILALHFSRCLLHAARRPVSPCDDADLERQGFSACTAKMSSEEFSTFTEYSTQVDLLCWHVENREWQSVLDGAVRNLLSGANSTAHALIGVARSAEQLRESHAAAISAGAAAMREVEARQMALTESAERMGGAIAASAERYTAIAAAIAQLSEYAAVLLHLQGYLVGCVSIAWTAESAVADGR